MEGEWDRTHAFEWYQFEWSWVTSNPASASEATALRRYTNLIIIILLLLLQGHDIIQRQITQKTVHDIFTMADQ